MYLVRLTYFFLTSSLVECSLSCYTSVSRFAMPAQTTKRALEEEDPIGGGEDGKKMKL